MKIIYAILACSLLLVGCSQLSPDEQFGNILSDLDKVFESFDIRKMDYSKKNYGLSDKTLLKAQSVQSRLQRFENKYFQNRYADDAAYILAMLSMGDNNRHVQALKDFLIKYPNASLEKKTLDWKMMATAKEMPVIIIARKELSMVLSFLKKYDESNIEARRIISDIGSRNLTQADQYGVFNGYHILIRNYEKLNEYSKAKEACQEAIKILPEGKINDTFVNKLKELNNATHGI